MQLNTLQEIEIQFEGYVIQLYRHQGQEGFLVYQSQGLFYQPKPYRLKSAKQSVNIS